ncbi:MAG: hypothetical protein ABL925_18210 [Methylococcales bacterium]
MRLIHTITFLIAGLLLASLSARAADDEENAYQLGSGYPIGETGWRIGGYASTKVELPRYSPWHFEVTDLSLFLSWDNGSRLRFFSELEAGDVLSAGEHQWPSTKNTHFEFERFYVDTLLNNQLSIRLGKFLTPIGQWNLIHAAPLVWTTFRPVATENLFSTHASGMMLHGAVPIGEQQLEYALYGDVSSDIDPHLSNNPFDNAVGARLRYSLNDNLQIGASFANFVLKERPSHRHSLAGLDVAWNYQKLELSSEVVYHDSEQAFSTDRWQGFIQGVGHISQHWALIGRYEFFEQPKKAMGQVGLFGIAYRPLPPVVWKLEYRLGAHNENLAPDGLAASFSILF